MTITLNPQQEAPMNLKPLPTHLPPSSIFHSPLSIIITFCLFLLLSPTPSALAAKNVALVIGNSSYDTSPLKNPANDATDMAALLKAAGFDVILKTDADKRAMLESIETFGRKLPRAEIGMLYFAGHGMQIRDRNYLIPVKARVASETDVELESVDVYRILGRMEAAANPVNIIILDACRDNPFERSFRTAEKGLAKIDAPAGSIIVFATAPGGVAADGRGRNGIFTSHLLKTLARPDISLTRALMETRRNVAAETSRQQIPWESSSLMQDVFLLAGGAPGDQNLRPVPPQSGVPSQPSDPRAPDKARLYVVTDPGGGQVRIMNIVDKYFDGIELDPGRYKLEGSLEGYRTRARWITIDQPGVVDVTLTLTPEPAAPAVAAPSVTAPAQTAPRTEPKPAPAKAPASRVSSPRAGDVWKEPVTGMEFVWVPKGCYQMGCGSWTSSCDDDEKPVHEVCLDGFWIGKYEVTQGQWKKIMGSNPSYYKSGDDFPVEKVSWNDAKEFISRLSRQSGNRFALPTEAQWEYAARSGGKNEKYAGGSNVDSVAWYDGNSGGKTHRVGTKAPNGLGIYDMSGNVWEWCEDVYDSNAYSKHARNNPVVTSGGTARVLRGGSWYINPGHVRAANRLRNTPDRRNFDLGFRLALPQVRQE
jgi:formylglycine-generating enzyme required for sulfatase activity